jgi:heme/copper-type cytochrome/quinol oxidase subunit 2
MKKSIIRTLLSMVGALVLAPTIFSPQSRSVLAQDQDLKVIELTAKKYEYSPSPVHVKTGTRVQLKITASDHDHAFKIGAVPDGAQANGTTGLILTSPQDCWQIKKGETTTIEFLAQISGTYTFRCCHTCGLGHRGMKGRIVVD